MDLIDCSCLRVKLGPKLVKVGGIEGISDWPDYTVGSNVTQIHRPIRLIADSLHTKPDPESIKVLCNSSGNANNPCIT